MLLDVTIVVMSQRVKDAVPGKTWEPRVQCILPNGHRGLVKLATNDMVDRVAVHVAARPRSIELPFASS